MVGSPSMRSPRGATAGTRLACASWSAFPGTWGGRARAFERMEAEAEDRIAAGVTASRADEDLLRRLDPDWVDFLRAHMPVAAFAFQGAGRGLQGAGEACHARGLATDLHLQGSMAMRQAQAIVLYAADMEHELGLMPMDSARDRYREDPEWRPVHAFLRQVSTLEDWGERLVAVNLCFEPLVGVLLRREVAIGLGTEHGDDVTPIVAAAGEAEWRLTREWTVGLLSFLVGNPDHAPHNRATLRGWLTDLRPGADAAARAVSQIIRQLPRAGDPAHALDRVRADQDDLLASVGLS